MPWSNQGGNGGPWGSGGGSGGGGGGGGQGPWGRGGGGGPTPPDLEDMIRKGQDRFKKALPSGFGGGIGFIIIILLGLAAWGFSGFYRVQADEQGVELVFGRYDNITNPGLQYVWPWPIGQAITPKVTSVNRIDIGFTSQSNTRGQTGTRDIPEESLMLTGDENIIDIDFTVLWRIYSASDYLFNIRDQEETVKLMAESVMREIIAKTDIQPALTEARQSIEADVKLLVQETLDSYGAGIEITQIQLQKVDPPQQVVDAFNDVLRARQDQQRVRNQAEAYRNDIIPRARGEAERMIQEASAYKEQEIATAQGEASRFLAVLRSYRLAPEVTAQRFFLETWEEFLQGANKVIIDNEGGGQGVVPYLPLNELQNRPVVQGQSR